MVFDDRLPLGVYEIFWNSGGSSLASVGMTHTGARWYAPCNWTADEQKSLIVASTDWDAVSHVSLVKEDQTFRKNQIAAGVVREGQYVRSLKKSHKKTGVVKCVNQNRDIEVWYHNGMKITNTFMKHGEFEILSKEDFVKYVQKTGHTSLGKYL